MYQTPRILLRPLGNNAFAYRPNRTLYVPSLVHATFRHVRPGKEVVFEEQSEDTGEVVSECGLENFVRTSWEGKDVFIFDNHNHAFAFWCMALQEWTVSKGFELVHIDMHSDLWPNDRIFDMDRIEDDSYIESFVDEETNVGNYIAPALASGMVRRVIRIEWEGDLDRTMAELVGENSILNLDLDFFEENLDDIPFSKKKAAILRFARLSKVITIATSPYFIDQELAIRRMHEIFG